MTTTPELTREVCDTKRMMGNE